NHGAVRMLHVHAEDGVVEAAVIDLYIINGAHADGSTILHIGRTDVAQREPANDDAGGGDVDDVAAIVPVDNRVIVAEQDNGERDDEAVLIIYAARHANRISGLGGGNSRRDRGAALGRPDPDGGGLRRGGECDDQDGCGRDLHDNACAWFRIATTPAHAAGWLPSS